METKWKTFALILWKLSICLKRLYYRNQKRQCLVITLASILAATIVYWFLIREVPVMYPDIKSTNDLVQRRLQEIVSSEKGTGCVMPALDPFSAEAMQFTRDVNMIVCEGEDWVECYKSECQATKHIQTQMKDLVCTYRDIMFLTDDTNQLGDPVKVYGGDTYVLDRSDHVKVSCTGTDANGFGLISSRWFGYKLGFRPVRIDPHEPSQNTDTNIMIVMFDSASRNGFMRRMPKSYKVLVEELEAVVMKSFNIVMDGTPGALFPLLTGHMELELPDSRQSLNNHRLIDDTPFIFHLLKEHGYRTAYFEDMPWIGTFQYRFNGFEHQPADHYLRPLFLEESKNSLKWWSGVNEKHCIGPTPRHCFMLNATAQFFELDGKKFCLNFISGITHDDFNMITTADEDLVKFLRSFKEKKMDDTVLIVMGDHGPRWSDIRKTFQGKIEERLPFVALVLPKNLKNSRPQALNNLIANAEVLTTHYDMHATFLDILNLKKHRNTYKVPGSDMERGLSLLEPIIKSRSCAEAGIMPHWCACAKWQEVNISDPLYQRVALALAHYIDSLTTDVRIKCAARTLSTIQWVLRQSPDASMLGYKGRGRLDIYLGNYEQAKHVRAASEYYEAKIVMNPGESIFEGSMQYIVKDDMFIITERDISRVNRYGDEPKCVSDKYPHLRKYCFCK